MIELLKKSDAGIFASQTLTGHLMRGAVALALLYWAITQQAAYPIGAVVAGIGALVAMRGCPACWTIGLVETIGQRFKHAPSALNSRSD